MASKHLKFEEYSSDEENASMVVKKPPAESSSEEEESSEDEGVTPLENKETASQVVVASSVKESSEEEEESSEEESADDEKEKETASQVLVAAAPTAKRKAAEEQEDGDVEEKTRKKKATLSSKVVVVAQASAAPTAKRKAAEEQEDGDVEEKTRKKKPTLSSKVAVVAQARSDMDKKKRKVTFSNEVVKHPRKKAKTSHEEENVAVVDVKTVNVKKEEIDQGASSGKKVPFQPLLKEKDRLRFLKGMIDFESDKGKKPVDDKEGFYYFVKGRLVEGEMITLSQCTGQIDSLQRKYKKKFFQGKIPSSYSNRYEKKYFELCKQIWGTKFALEKSRKSERVQIKEEKDVIDLECGDRDWFGKSKDLLCLVTAFGVEEGTVRKMWTSVPTRKKKKMEKKWSVLKQKEFELFTDKTGFVTEMVSMMAAEASSQ